VFIYNQTNHVRRAEANRSTYSRVVAGPGWGQSRPEEAEGRKNQKQKGSSWSKKNWTPKLAPAEGRRRVRRVRQRPQRSLHRQVRWPGDAVVGAIPTTASLKFTPLWKTWMRPKLERYAYSWSCSQLMREGKDVFCCYSRGMGNYLGRTLCGWYHQQRHGYLFKQVTQRDLCRGDCDC